MKFELDGLYKSTFSADMSTIITPKDIIESLISEQTKPFSFRPWENKLQKWLFIFSLCMLTIGAIAAGTTHFFNSKWIAFVALMSLVFSQIGGLLYQLSAIVPGLRMLRNPERTVTSVASEKFNDDIERVSSLARDFEQHHLDYARDRMALTSEQLKQRIALAIGAIEKVGILPSAVAGFFYAKDIVSKAQFVSSGVEWCLVGFILFYILTCQLIFVAQRLDRFALILKHAASKKEKDSKLNDNVRV